MKTSQNSKKEKERKLGVQKSALSAAFRAVIPLLHIPACVSQSFLWPCPDFFSEFTVKNYLSISRIGLRKN